MNLLFKTMLTHIHSHFKVGSNLPQIGIFVIDHLMQVLKVKEKTKVEFRIERTASFQRKTRQKIGWEI